ncbi:CoA-binding protein [Candidatus Bathyarchaeota archaeon]|nr:CoA-binding protein [Candidatus Bathyarchaeota archaeon]
MEGLSQEEIKSVLETYRTVAIVGLSRDPDKASYRVAQYLESVGYRIIPVNPFADEILGEKCYKSLLEVPDTIDIVDIFRPSEDVPAIVDEAITIKNRVGSPNVIWMQLGIVNEEAAKRAREAGFTVVVDRCMMIEHRRLSMDGVLDS